MKTVYIAISADILHHGHINLIKKASEYGELIVGILTDRDILLRAVACDKDACNTKVSDIMSTKVFCCDSNSEVEEAEKIMSQEQIRRIPIVEHGKIAGILTLGNLASNDAIPKQDLCDTIEKICECNFKNAE